MEKKSFVYVTVVSIIGFCNKKFPMMGVDKTRGEDCSTFRMENIKGSHKDEGERALGGRIMRSGTWHGQQPPNHGFFPGNLVPSWVTSPWPVSK